MSTSYKNKLHTFYQKRGWEQPLYHMAQCKDGTWSCILYCPKTKISVRTVDTTKKKAMQHAAHEVYRTYLRCTEASDRQWNIIR